MAAGEFLSSKSQREIALAQIAEERDRVSGGQAREDADGRARLQSREDSGESAVREPDAPVAPTPAQRRTYWLAGAAALAVMLAAVAWYRLEADVTGMVAVQLACKTRRVLPERLRVGR